MTRGRDIAEQGYGAGATVVKAAPVRSVSNRSWPDPGRLPLVELVELGVEILRGLDVDLGQDPVEPARDPPVAVPEQLHRGRHQQEPDDGGVDQDGYGEPEAEQLHDPVRLADEA